jgi:hypothetical protein
VLTLSLTLAFHFIHQGHLLSVNITDEELEQIHPHAKLARKVLTKDRVADVLNRGAIANTFGLRGYYVAFPIVAWMFGPWYLLGSTVIMCIGMVFMDYNLEWMGAFGGAGGLPKWDETERADLMKEVGMSVKGESERRDGKTKDELANIGNRGQLKNSEEMQQNASLPSKIPNTKNVQQEEIIVVENPGSGTGWIKERKRDQQGREKENSESQLGGGGSSQALLMLE